MGHWRGVCAAILCFLAALTVASNAAEQPPPGAPAATMRERIERYLADLGALERFYDVSISPERQSRLREFYHQQLDDLGRIDFQQLDQPGRIDYLLLKNKLTFESSQLENRQRQWEEIADVLPFAQSIAELEESRQRMQPLDSERAAQVMTELTREIADAQKTAQRKLSDAAEKAHVAMPILARRAAGAADRLEATLRHWYAFYDHYNPEFTWWMREPYPKAESALGSYSSYLRRNLAGFRGGDEDPVIGDPIGREALLESLRAEMIPYTPEELIEIANREFAWCQVEMKRAAHDLGCGDDWHAALAKVSQMHVNPGEQPQLIRQLAEEAIKFVEDRDLVTVPALCKETWRMEMMPVERQKLNPYFTGGEEIRVSFPTDTMSDEDKQMSMRGNNIPFCRATVFHELIPGHCLQLFMAQRYRPYRRTFTTPFLIEGWALYWEMRFWDLGFPRTPEERVGMLFWRSHRCARIIFSLKFHLGQMSANEAIDMLVNRIGHERRNATAEVRRSIVGEYGPLYQAAYMLGALQLRTLHKDLVQSGKMTDRQFNDAVLRENSIPVEMIRASLTNQKLTPDFATNWRFYGEVEPAQSDSRQN